MIVAPARLKDHSVIFSVWSERLGVASVSRFGTIDSTSSTLFSSQVLTESSCRPACWTVVDRVSFYSAFVPAVSLAIVIKMAAIASKVVGEP